MKKEITQIEFEKVWEYLINGTTEVYRLLLADSSLSMLNNQSINTIKSNEKTKDYVYFILEDVDE